MRKKHSSWIRYLNIKDGQDFQVYINHRNTAQHAIIRAPQHGQTLAKREFMHHVNVPKIRQTNFNCSVKVDVLSDRTPPRIEVKFGNDDTAVFKTQNLTTLEIMKNFNDMCRERESNTS
ncbi:hypothetical protein LSAT2_030747 [Lamellibrachia satsuma]|nr:hypothetical protein LSAT2_030747 [Lamellibrachia satsuma]